MLSILHEQNHILKSDIACVLFLLVHNKPHGDQEIAADAFRLRAL